MTADAPLSADQEAALNQPISRLAMAQCMLGLSSSLFNSDYAKEASNAVADRLHLPGLVLQTGVRDFFVRSLRTAACDSVKKGKKAEKGTTRKAIGVTPYKLFISYATKELHKHKDLPMVRKFMVQQGDAERISFSAANSLWASLPAADKVRQQLIGLTA